MATGMTSQEFVSEIKRLWTDFPKCKAPGFQDLIWASMKNLSRNQWKKVVDHFIGTRTWPTLPLIIEASEKILAQEREFKRSKNIPAFNLSSLKPRNEKEYYSYKEAVTEIKKFLAGFVSERVFDSQAADACGKRLQALFKDNKHLDNYYEVVGAAKKLVINYALARNGISGVFKSTERNNEQEK